MIGCSTPLTDRVRERGEQRIVEALARLGRVGVDVLQGDVAQAAIRALARTEVCHVARIAGNRVVDPQRSPGLRAHRALTAVTCSARWW